MTRDWQIFTDLFSVDKGACPLVEDLLIIRFICIICVLMCENMRQNLHTKLELVIYHFELCRQCVHNLYTNILSKHAALILRSFSRRLAVACICSSRAVKYLAIAVCSSMEGNSICPFDMFLL